MTFTVIEITTNQALNTFFSFPIYTMFVTLPFLALFDIFKRL